MSDSPANIPQTNTAADDTTTTPSAAQYDISALSHQPFPDAPPGFLINLVLRLRRFLLRLADLVVPADAAVFERIVGVGHTVSIGAITRLGVPDILAQGPLSAKALAERTGCNADAMHRTMRAMVTGGVFKLDREGRFANNRLSRELCAGRLNRAKEFAEYFSSKSNVLAYAEFDHVLKTGEEGFMHANGKDLWQWFDAHPEELETFAQMMMGVTNGEAPMVAKLYPFEEITRLCDVGGGRGSLLSELVVRYPHLQGVLFDCEGVIASAGPLLEARGVADKIECETGDFYTAVPAGCDAYMLKNVMHDWDDGRCKIILDNCRKVMKKGNKVLLVEIVLEEFDRTNFAALRDIHVLTVCTGGRERSRADYARLLRTSGFEPGRVFVSPIISVIEGVVA
ncbi:MAG: hypothetical protein COA42_18270 [Alteromonadaceae bacterium]|nr:MAG: hypothetical protein COA42_18270 [Alteromonadaceae bacterium]